MEQMNNQSPQTLQNPQGQPEAAGAAGTAHVPAEYGIGAFNAPGVNPQKVISQIRSEQVQGQATSATVTPPQGQLTPGTEGAKQPAQQPSEKDQRHFAQAITQAAQAKYDFARLAIESDENAIFKIAETDKDLAARLLKEYDYGTTDVQELLDRQTVTTAKNPQEAQKEISDAKWKKDMETRLLESEILRLKGENPDLTGETETKFRELMQDPVISKKFNTEQLVNMARAISTPSKQQNNNDAVAIALLSREEGMVASPKGATQPEKTKVISPEMKQMLKAARMTEKDLGVLPDNIEEMINQSLGGPLIGR